GEGKPVEPGVGEGQDAPVPAPVDGDDLTRTLARGRIWSHFHNQGWVVGSGTFGISCLAIFQSGCSSRAASAPQNSSYATSTVWASLISSMVATACLPGHTLRPCRPPC